MSTYRETILKATGCNAGDAAMIEDIMRNDIFRSTLDWQTADELHRAAREAKRSLDENRPLFENYRRLMRAAAARMKTEQIPTRDARKKSSSPNKKGP